ncbi:hypothetical protein OSCT_1278 [Oscillochloris trichoides DG-6]|uniref:Uncharacterized protein n=1 Tax=Oscillochloris trichoides DG-6 TaxID=765420 RepID=E1ID77_9CHLR|nr:hypothetical protein OSCT_1278 [Oscillochloris trichoides DG-6]
MSLLALIGLSAQISPVSGQSNPQRQVEFTISNSNNHKFPGITAYNDKVYIGAGINSAGAGVKDLTRAWSWSLGDQASSVSWEAQIGAMDGYADYSSVAMAASSNGDIYAVWSSSKENRIYFSRLPSGGTVWEGRQTIASGRFMFFPQIAVYGSDIYVIWNQSSHPLSLMVRKNGNWSGPYLTQYNTYSVAASVATGPSGHVAISYSTQDLATAIAIFNGTSLSNTNLTGSARGADSSISIDANGKYYAAWRGLDSSGAYSGVFLGESSNGVNWSTRQLVSGDVKGGTVNVIVDGGGTLHLGWTALVSGSLRGYYTYRLPGQSNFMTAASTSTAPLFNSRMAISSGGRYAHLVAENHSNYPQKVLYTRFAGAPGTGISATPVIAGGANSVGVQGKTSISVSFTDLRVVQSNTYQVRWNWGSAPTDANPWQALSLANPTISVSVPNVTSCSSATLYTQIKDVTTGLVEVPAKTDSVVIDSDVQARARVSNPYVALASLSNTDSLAAELALSKGAVGAGDPLHTRIAVVYLDAYNAGDCSGVSSVTLSHNGSSGETYKLVNDRYQGFVPLPDLMNLVTGEWPVTITIQDGAGNTQETTIPIVFDDQAPVFSSVGTPTATPNPQADILQDLTFPNVVVSDNLYQNGTREFWGVWLANSTSIVGDPSTLNWISAPVEDVNSTTVRVRNWSLTAGLTEPLPTPGERTTYIYVRFLDGAGNATTATPLRIDVTSNFNPVKVNLPAVMR